MLQDKKLIGGIALQKMINITRQSRKLRLR